MSSLEYPLMEDFYTIQGEGYNTGKAAYFIRLAGCDVGCVWCDVKDSWSVENHPRVSTDEMLKRIKESGTDKVVITGGEPAMYDLQLLTGVLRMNNLYCYIETSGAYKLTGTWDWICVSPKKFKAPLPEVLKKANELKVIIFNKSDFDWAEKNAMLVDKDCLLYLQPEYSVIDNVMPMIIDYVMKNTQWRISLQTHKIIGVR